MGSGSSSKSKKYAEQNASKPAPGIQVTPPPNRPSAASETPAAFRGSIPESGPGYGEAIVRVPSKTRTSSKQMNAAAEGSERIGSKRSSGEGSERIGSKRSAQHEGAEGPERVGSKRSSTHRASDASEGNGLRTSDRQVAHGTSPGSSPRPDRLPSKSEAFGRTPSKSSRHDGATITGGGSASNSRAPSHASVAPSHHSNNDKLIDDIQEKFPGGEFDYTLYASLPRFRPADPVVFQDFTEKRTMNGLKGACVDHDPKLHVWTILLSDGKEVRVIPPAVQKAMQTKFAKAVETKPIEGFVVYGADIVQVILDQEENSGSRHVREHVTKQPTPRQEGVRQEQVVAEPKQKAKRKAKASPKPSIDDRVQDVQEVGPREFKTGDMVMMKDIHGRRLGTGKIQGEGDKPGMVRVEFGQRGGVYNLETSELEHFDGDQQTAEKLKKQASMTRRPSMKVT